MKGDYFNPRNIAAICDINDGEKSDNVEAIGYKGIGFKTVFLDDDFVYLNTGNYSFKFDRSATDVINTPWQILPVWTDNNTLPLSFKMCSNIVLTTISGLNLLSNPETEESFLIEPGKTTTLTCLLMCLKQKE